MLRPGGRLAYSQIFVTPGLSPADRRRAVDLGPPEVASRLAPLDLLESAGFTNALEVDVTRAFLDTYRALLAARARYAVEFRAQDGGEVFDEEQTRKEKVARGIEAGFLRRSLLVGTNPGRIARPFRAERP